MLITPHVCPKEIRPKLKLLLQKHILDFPSPGRWHETNISFTWLDCKYLEGRLHVQLSPALAASNFPPHRAPSTMT